MVYRTFKAIAPLALLLVTAACGGNQTDVKEPDETDGTQTVVAPPPPPKCESLDEKCASKGEKTVAKVKSADLVFHPAEKWIYAQGEAQTIAQASDEGAVVVFGSYAPDKDTKKDGAARDAALAELVKAAALTLPKGAKVNWKQKPDNQEVNGIKLNVWQMPGTERAKKKGTLLVLQASLPDDKALLALGFAADDDEAGMGAVSKAIESIKADEKKAGDDKKADDKKTDGEKK